MIRNNCVMFLAVLACSICPGYAQFTYDIIDDTTVTITGYTGTGGEVMIPDFIEGLPVTKIGNRAFDYVTSLTSITLADSITSIGFSAFEGCTSLISVTIGNSVTFIGDGAFYGCASLTNIALPDNLTRIDEFTFSGCTSLTSVTIGNSVSRIEQFAFNECTSLTSIILPESVAGIGFSPFYGCTNLLAIEVASINASFSCLDGVLFNKSQTILVAFPGGMAGSYIIPDSVTSIGDGSFSGCASLTNITIPGSVRYIGLGVFSSCASLTGFTLPNSVTSIGIAAFSSCSNLTSIIIPDSVTSIGSGAFAFCPILNSVYFTGNAPAIELSRPQGVYDDASLAINYYLPETTGWDQDYGGRPTALWLPKVLTAEPGFGVQAGHFGFTVSWSAGQVVVVEASDDLVTPEWTSISTNTLFKDTFFFSDPNWNNHPTRFFRLTWQ